MRLEDITEGSIVMGIVPHEPVSVGGAAPGTAL